MNLSEELIVVLERAKQTDEYFNPHIINGVINAIYDGDPDADKLVSDELADWAVSMYSW